MNIRGTTPIDITDSELGWTLLARACELACVDSAGCDLYTDDEDNVYIGGLDESLGYNPRLAAMVDAANYLIYGKRLALCPAQAAARALDAAYTQEELDNQVKTEKWNNPDANDKRWEK